MSKYYYCYWGDGCPTCMLTTSYASVCEFVDYHRALSVRFGEDAEDVVVSDQQKVKLQLVDDLRGIGYDDFGVKTDLSVLVATWRDELSEGFFDQDMAYVE